MTQNDKFRELLAKARSITQDSLDSNITGFDEPDYVCKCEACERYRDLIGQIDAALAEPIDKECSTCKVSKAFHDVVVRERNAAWREIEQLKEQLEWQSACTKALGQSQDRLVKEIQRLGTELHALKQANKQEKE